MFELPLESATVCLWARLNEMDKKTGKMQCSRDPFCVPFKNFHTSGIRLWTYLDMRSFGPIFLSFSSYVGPTLIRGELLT